MNRLTGLNFDEFENAIRGARGYYIPVGRNTHDWQLQHLALADMEVMLGHNGGGAIYKGACPASNFGVFFPLSNVASLAVNGEQANTTTLTWLVPEREFRVYNSEAMTWIGVSVGREAVDDWLELTHENFRPDVRSHRIGRIEAALIERLKDIVTRAFDVCGADPNVWDATASNMLYRQLSWAIYESVQSMGFHRPATVQGRPRLSRDVILRRALEWLETADIESMSMPDLCRAAGVSNRTLHAVFVESFGISPYRFFVLQRLRKIHDALKEAGPDETVADVCRRFGVWDAGRFSSVYRRVYGAYPSRILAATKAANRVTG